MKGKNPRQVDISSVHYIMYVRYVIFFFNLFGRIFLRGSSTRHEDSPTVMSISLKYELPESQDGNECE